MNPVQIRNIFFTETGLLEDLKKSSIEVSGHLQIRSLSLWIDRPFNRLVSWASAPSLLKIKNVIQVAEHAFFHGKEYVISARKRYAKLKKSA